MIYAQIDNERLKLLEHELNTTKDAKWYRRLKVIHLSCQGKTVPQLTKLLDVCEASVRDYIKRYNKGGLDGLRRNNSDGRPPRIHLTKSQWEELIHQSPCNFPKLNTGSRNWTQKMLSDYCEQYLGVQIGRTGISMLLKRMGIRWNRGKLKVTSPDPEYTLKRERVDRLKKKPSKEP